MFKPLVLIPSYNTGAILNATLKEVLAATEVAVLVVFDGTSDGSDLVTQRWAQSEPRLTVIVKPVNEGKGAAVRTGLLAMREHGYTHALVMDADGQHPAESIDLFLKHAEQAPTSMILGQPIFDDDVPLERLYGRKLTVWLVQLEVMSRAIGDPLYGFRVYPIEPLLRVMAKPGRSDRYDFDPEVAVRLNWTGTPSVKLPAKVEYIDAAAGGISHFHYIRDNARYVCLHTRLILEAPFRWFRQGR